MHTTRDALDARFVMRIAALLIAALYFFPAVKDPDGTRMIDVVNLVFHEAGHTIFFFAPETLTILAGSLMQVTVPLAIAGYFALRREFFSVGLTLHWVGQSIANVSVYAGDAFTRALPLLGGDAVIHDWAYLSAHLGLGRSVLVLADALYALGVMTLLFGFLMSLAVILAPVFARQR